MEYRAESIMKYISLHPSSFWITLLLLVYSVVMYALSLKIYKDITPNNCAAIQNDKQNKKIQPILYPMSLIGLIGGGMIVIWLLFHFFNPINK